MEQPNLSYIRELSEGDHVFEKKIVQILQKELPEEYKEFLRSFNERKFKETAENVHKLKHKISILGLVKGYEIASTFEEDLKKDHKTHLYKSFCSIIEVMIDFIKPL